MDYSKYSFNELMDSLNNIDKDAHPENYKKLVLGVENRKPEFEAAQKQGSTLIHRFLSISAMIFLLSACTTGKLYYTKASGERVLGCYVEFVGIPSVDKFAVEYALSLCAKSSVKKGYSIDKEKEYLLTLELQIPESKCGESWNHKSVKKLYKTGKLSKKEYGYIVAHIDLGLAVVYECSPITK